MNKISLDLLKLHHIKKNEYLVGFEVECIYDNSKCKEFKTEIQAIHSKIVMGDDGSIHVDGVFHFERTTEIRTPPLPVKESLRVLDLVFEVLKKYGYTNRSCGFHVNISPISNTKYYKVNPFYLVKLPIWSKMKKQFNRASNQFCCKTTPIKKVKPITPLAQWQILSGEDSLCDYVDAYIEDDHYQVINFLNMPTKRDSTSRIELRAMGNKDYHLRLPEIMRNINKTLAAIDKSCKVKTSLF